jgi:polyisoprenoid-binding protein YceI
MPFLLSAQVPVYEVIPADSKVGFFVKASVNLEGKFKKWDASLKFTSPKVDSGVLLITAQADSVDAGSSMKEGKLKGDDFFAVKKHPQITFRSTGMTSTGPDQYRIEGEFTIRGVSRKETLNLTVKRDQPNEGRIQGQMAFDRREYGMTHGIPFIKIADRVEVNVDLHARRVSGPPIQPK